MNILKEIKIMEKGIFNFFSSVWFILISMGIIITMLGIAYHFNKKEKRNVVAKLLSSTMDYIVIFIFISCLASAEKYGRNTLHVILMGICCLWPVVKIISWIKRNKKNG